MLSLVFYYCRENRYSVNALAGALEASGIKGIKASFPRTPAEMASELRAASRSGTASIAAFSFFTCQAAATAALVKKLRGNAPGALFIAGGPHTSAVPRETLSLGFDYAVTGEGEKAFTEFLAAVKEGRTPPRGIIKGGPSDLSLPPFSTRYGLFGPIEITRGCPYACSYCQTSFLFGAKPRHRPLSRILRHMETMLSRGFTEIRFISPDAFAYGSRDGKELNLPALSELLMRAGRLAEGRGGRIYIGSFPSEVRPDHVTPETLALVKKYACNRRLVIGAQAASPRALAAIKRGHGPEEIMNAARLCREYRITPYLDFIFGLPGETPADEDAAMAMITELVGLGAMIHTHAFMPLPGTPLAGAPRARISRRMGAFISKIEARGRAFGKWRSQRAARLSGKAG